MVTFSRRRSTIAPMNKTRAELHVACELRKGLSDEPTRAQNELCRRYGVDFVAAPPELKGGIARNVREGVLPINGLRHPPEGDTTGWHIWAGEELSNDPDFFVPLHVEHLDEWCPAAISLSRPASGMALPRCW